MLEEAQEQLQEQTILLDKCEQAMRIGARAPDWELLASRRAKVLSDKLVVEKSLARLVEP